MVPTRLVAAGADIILSPASHINLRPISTDVAPSKDPGGSVKKEVLKGPVGYGAQRSAAPLLLLFFRCTGIINTGYI